MPQTDKVDPEDEQAMLRKFADLHKLGYRLAVQKDQSLNEFYAVTGIPQVVVIDQEGKIRLIRIDGGSKNAEDIENLLAELLKD